MTKSDFFYSHSCGIVYLVLVSTIEERHITMGLFDKIFGTYSERELKRINKARSAGEYRASVSALFSSGRFDADACFPGALPGIPR